MKAGTRESIIIIHIFLPTFDQDSADSSNLKPVFHGACFGAVSAPKPLQNTLHGKRALEVIVVEYSPLPGIHCICVVYVSLPFSSVGCTDTINPLVDHCVQGEVVCDCGAEDVGEMADRMKFIVVDGDEWQCLSILSQYVRILPTDRQSEEVVHQ